MTNRNSKSTVDLLRPGFRLLEGIVVPTVTPLTAEGRLDVDGLECLVTSLAQVSGLFVAGTTGEGPALSRDTRREMIQRVCALVEPKQTVVVAAIDPSVDEALETARVAADAGADAIAASPPFYMALSKGDILRFGLLLAEQSPLPVYLYNVPYAYLPQFDLETLRRLADCPNILGLKDSSGNFAQMEEAIRIFAGRPECSVMVGPESQLTDALRAGAAGGVSGGANLIPALYMELYRAHVAGDASRVDVLQERILGVERDFYRVGELESGLVRGLKAALTVRGICASTMVKPYLPASPDEIASVEKALEGYAKWLPEVKSTGQSKPALCWGSGRRGPAPGGS